MSWLVLSAVVAGIVVLAPWILACLARRFGREEVQIPKPVQIYGKLTPPEVEALRVRAEIRQHRAEAKRTEGNQIASGEPERAIKLVGRNSR